jgi:hypothetical protein
MTSEPRTLTIHDNPARRFTVSNESGFVAEIDIEYRGGGWWRAELNDGGDPRKRERYTSRSLADVQRWAATTMEEQADKARATCSCGTNGMDDPIGSGNFACGVLSPHGISVMVTDGDGTDVTQDYLINGF